MLFALGSLWAIIFGGRISVSYLKPMILTDPNPDEIEPRSGRRLNSLDWTALTLLALALLASPLTGGQFSTPGRNDSLPAGLLEILGVSLPSLLASAAAMIALYRESKRPVAMGEVAGVKAAWIALIVWALLSSLRNPVPYLAVNALFALISAVLLGAMIARLGRDRNAIAALLLVLCGAGTLTGVLTAAEYLEQYRAGVYYYRAFGGFVNPDFLAGYLLLTLPVTLACFASSRDTLVRTGCGIGLLIQSSAILLTGSRAGVGVLFVSILLWLLMLAYTGELKANLKPILTGLAVFALGAVLASAPTLSRVSGTQAPLGEAGIAPVSAAASQSHSAEFRKYTWMGTAKMARKNPILGTGIGSFEVAYPGYAITAFTAHAHNAYLQWASETGFVGGMILMTGFAAIGAFALRILWIGARRRKEPDAESEDEPFPRFRSPLILLCGLLASLTATLLHGFIDSDWYIVATLTTLAAILGLTLALSRDFAPLATLRPAPLKLSVCFGGVLLALLLIGRGVMQILSRSQFSSATIALIERKAPEALDAYALSALFDPLDPEPHLQRALLFDSVEKPAEAKMELEEALKRMPTGKTYYRLAQHEGRTGNAAGQIAAYEETLKREPSNVQTLRALGDAQRAAGKLSEAKLTYTTLTELENSPYGTVRAMPELVEMEFAFAHLSLGELASDAGDKPAALAEYPKAASLFRTYWGRRTMPMVAAISEAKKANYREAYVRLLSRWLADLPPNSPERPALEREAAEVKGSRG